MKKFLLNLDNHLNLVTFESGKEIIALSDKYEHYDLFRDLVHGTEMMPDDTKFEMIDNVLRKMLDYDFDSVDELREFEHEIIDSCISIYNHDLLKWLSSNLLRLEYCDQAIGEGLCLDNMISQIQSGQFLELSEIFSGIIDLYEQVGE